MKEFAIIDLATLSGLIEEINAENYSAKLELLSNASIGEHLRHILEFYIAIIIGYQEDEICYDKRKRDTKLETDIAFALFKIDEIKRQLSQLDKDKRVKLLASYDAETEKPLVIQTSVYRELGYCIEHSIHHQALIKIALKLLQPEINIDDKFGVAPATIRYRRKESCVQ